MYLKKLSRSGSLGSSSVVLDLVGESHLLKQPEDALRARVVQVMYDNRHICGKFEVALRMGVVMVVAEKAGRSQALTIK